MKVVALFLLSTVSAFPFEPDTSYCCRYASMMENCHDICLEIFKAPDAAFLEMLQLHFPTNCPRNSPELVDFWNCLAPAYNGTSGAWVGKMCCEQAAEDRCRSACLQSRSREDLAISCRVDYEENLYDCVFKQQSRQKCCGRREGVSSSCRHRCDIAFRSISGPLSSDVDAITSRCDHDMAQCMANYTEVVRSKSTESVRCCDEAADEDCRDSCKRILKTEFGDDTIITELRKVCGEILPHKPLWKCFLKNPKPSPPSGPFVTKLQCCARSVSYTCKRLCKELFGTPWSDPSSWNQFERQCKHNSDEIDLQQCLEEVNTPCRMGCSGLSFCTNFNDRPTSLFHNCNAEGDDMARDYFNAWSGGTIQLPFLIIPVKDIQKCEPNKWKAVACALQIKPCSTKTGESIICKKDCLSLLNKCADEERFHGMEIEDLCEGFSPAHLQSNCISLSDYTKPGKSHDVDQSEVSQPCFPNPCEDGHVCVINRKPCRQTTNCPKYKCYPGCKMGSGSEFVVNHGALVRIPDTPRGEGCFKSCICSTSGSLRPCSNLPCTNERKVCRLAGQLREHGTNFYVDCNFCSCYDGAVQCTKRQCPSTEEEKLRHTGTVCNCPTDYSPVCGSDGRTYPSECVATCLRRTEVSFVKGSCPSHNPCIHNPCRTKERCVYTPRVCLSNFPHCRQYECLPRYRQCSRLLRSAIPLFEGKAYKHRDHQYKEYQQILSSSHFFSNEVLLSNESAACDTDNKQHENICKLTRSKRRKLAYNGFCQTRCGSHNAKLVCGQDRVTYNHSCMSEASGVLVDHVGACKSITIEEDPKKKCVEVVCPPLSNPDCSTVRPPGSCCPICGGMLRVLINQEHLEAIRKTPWNGPVTVRDVIWLLRRQLHVLECQLYGYLTTEGDMAIVVVSTKQKSTKIQEVACTREAERLSNLINKRSPTLTSYLILSPLTSATLSPSDIPAGAQSSKSSLLAHLLLTLFYLLMCRLAT